MLSDQSNWRSSRETGEGAFLFLGGKMLKYSPQIGQAPPPKSSGTGIAVAVFGTLAALGGAALVAHASRSKPQPKLGRPRLVLKKPCGCGR